MSDLSATNCGCECDERNGSNNSCMWLILLLLFCGGGCGHNDCGYGGGCDNSCLMIILLLFCCGGCGSLGNFNGCC